jgi:hypothetical protein
MGLRAEEEVERRCDGFSSLSIIFFPIFISMELEGKSKPDESYPAQFFAEYASATGRTGCLNSRRKKIRT